MIVKQGNMTFDGIDAKDHGILISGEGTFDAPARVYEMVEVPGRNGAVAIDQGRYENIEITYPAGVWGEDPQTFRERLAAYRSELGARIGYKRLEDTYHPDEFRMGIFSDAIEVEPSGYNTAGKFEVVFNCKPQRFLKSGEAKIDVSGSRRHEVSGNPITFIKDSYTIIHSFTGYIFPAPINQGIPSPATPARVTPLDVVTLDVNGTEYAMDFPNTNEGDAKYMSAQVDLTNGLVTGGAVIYEITGTEAISAVDVYGTTVFDITLDNLPPIDTTAAKCTRFVWSGLLVPGNLECALYGGNTLRVRYDELGGNVDYFRAMLSNWALTEPLAIYGPLTTYSADVLPTSPTFPNTTDTVTLTHADVIFPKPDMELDITAVVMLTNPTPFRAYPLVEITGTGTVTIGDTTLTISSNANPPIYLDCELMEAYSIVGGVITSANSQISMSNHIFPSLPPGASVIQASSGITGLKVTPRWWRL